MRFMPRGMIAGLVLRPLLLSALLLVALTAPIQAQRRSSSRSHIYRAPRSTRDRLV
jgi:hypothetical protein